MNVEDQVISMISELSGQPCSKCLLDTNLFDLGFNSLTLCQLVARLHRSFGATISIMHLWEDPTVGCVIKAALRGT